MPAPPGKDADPKESLWDFEGRGRRLAVIGARDFACNVAGGPTATTNVHGVAYDGRPYRAWSREGRRVADDGWGNGRHGRQPTSPSPHGCTLLFTAWRRLPPRSSRSAPLRPSRPRAAIPAWRRTSGQTRGRSPATASTTTPTASSTTSTASISSTVRATRGTTTAT